MQENVIDYKSAPKQRYGGHPNPISQSINEKLKGYSVWEEIDKKIDYHKTIAFDVKQVYEKLVIPDYVVLKDIEYKGVYNGKAKRRGVEYYDGYCFSKTDLKIYKVDVPFSMLQKTYNGKYIGLGTFDLLDYYFQIYNWHIEEAIYMRKYSVLNDMIARKNALIKEALSYGMDKKDVLEILERTKRRANEEFDNY